MNIETRPTYLDLMPGDPCPWLRHRRSANQLHCGLDDRLLPPGLDRMAGRYRPVLCIGRRTVAANDAVLRHRSEFDEEHACFFVVSIDPADQAEKRVEDKLPGVRFFWDFHGMLSRLCGALPRGRSSPQLRALARRQAPDGSAPPEPSPRSSSMPPLEYVQECPRRVEAMGEVRSRSLST